MYMPKDIKNSKSLNKKFGQGGFTYDNDEIYHYTDLRYPDRLAYFKGGNRERYYYIDTDGRERWEEVPNASAVREHALKAKRYFKGDDLTRRYYIDIYGNEVEEPVDNRRPIASERASSNPNKGRNTDGYGNEGSTTAVNTFNGIRKAFDEAYDMQSSLTNFGSEFGKGVTEGTINNPVMLPAVDYARNGLNFMDALLIASGVGTGAVLTVPKLRAIDGLSQSAAMFNNFINVGTLLTHAAAHNQQTDLNPTEVGLDAVTTTSGVVGQFLSNSSDPKLRMAGRVLLGGSAIGDVTSGIYGIYNRRKENKYSGLENNPTQQMLKISSTSGNANRIQDNYKINSIPTIYSIPYNPEKDSNTYVYDYLTDEFISKPTHLHWYDKLGTKPVKAGTFTKDTKNYEIITLDNNSNVVKRSLVAPVLNPDIEPNTNVDSIDKNKFILKKDFDLDYPGVKTAIIYHLTPENSYNEYDKASLDFTPSNRIYYLDRYYPNTASRGFIIGDINYQLDSDIEDFRLFIANRNGLENIPTDKLFVLVPDSPVIWGGYHSRALYPYNAIRFDNNDPESTFVHEVFGHGSEPVIWNKKYEEPVPDFMGGSSTTVGDLYNKIHENLFDGIPSNLYQNNYFEPIELRTTNLEDLFNRFNYLSLPQELIAPMLQLDPWDNDYKYRLNKIMEYHRLNNPLKYEELKKLLMWMYLHLSYNNLYSELLSNLKG